MKKIIIAVALLLIIVAVSVAEMVITPKKCDTLTNRITTLEQIVDLDEQQVKRADTNAAFAKAHSYWKKSCRTMFMTSAHHLVTYEIDRSFAKIKTLIDINQFVDLKTEIAALLNQISIAKDSVGITFINLL